MQKRGDKIFFVGKKGCDDMEDHHSRQTYIRGVKSFCEWLSDTKGIKYTGQVEKAGYGGYTELIRAYIADMVSGAVTKSNGQPFSAATISTYAKGICHGLRVDYTVVNKDGIVPKRTADRITKGTGRGVPEANRQGRQQSVDPKYARFVLLSQITGARRTELSRIRGRNLVVDESGHLCVEIEKGKGGKHQLQRIFPWDQADIRKLFDGVKPKDFVLSKAECNNKIDVHYIRAKHCQTAYEYFLEQIMAGGADRLRTELVARWKAEHIRGKDAQDRKAFQLFLDALRDPSAYKLRGANRQVAVAHKRPTEYNRLAMMCVSVFCLSHWRLDVTSVNYLTR